MKQIFTLLFLLVSISMVSQTLPEIPIKKVETRINTIGGSEIIIELTIDFNKKDGVDNSTQLYKDYKLNETSTLILNSLIKFQLKSNKFSNLIDSKIEYKTVYKGDLIRLRISKVNTKLVKAFSSDKSDFYLSADGNMPLIIWKNKDKSTNTNVQISKVNIEKKTKQNPLTLTDSMAEELIESRGGELMMVQNKFDFGLISADESSSEKLEVNASFSYRKKYSFLPDNIPVFFSAEGLISTNAKDSLNFISVYPINYNFLGGKSQFVGQLGMEGNQTFSNYRITANFFWNGIIPNLIDLTFGENRLRLKPVVKLGAKFYKEVENNRPVQLNNKEFSNQAFGEIYYYIPVQSIYSIILEGRAFYDFNNSLNPGKNIGSNYSITFGLEVPKTKLKTIFKYSKGTNGVTFEKDDYFIVGLLLDSFGINK